MTTETLFAARGWGGITPTLVQGAFRTTAECTQCGAIAAISFKTTVPPNFAHRKFDQKGWNVVGRVLCPSCAKPKRKPKEIDIMADKFPLKVVSAVVGETPNTTSVVASAKKKMRELIQLTYDEVSSRYEDGYSDAKIAEETGLSEAFVAKHREEFHGPLTEPDEVSQLRRDISALTASLGSIQSKFDSMCCKNGWKR